MTGQLRAGGLALVIGYMNSPINVGKCVTLVKLMQSGDHHFYGGSHCRYVGPNSVWLVAGDGIVGRRNGKDEVRGHALVSPRHLMPLDGPNVDFTNEARREWSDDAFLRIVRDLRDSLGPLKEHRNT